MSLDSIDNTSKNRFLMDFSIAAEIGDQGTWYSFVFCLLESVLSKCKLKLFLNFALWIGLDLGHSIRLSMILKMS